MEENIFDKIIVMGIIKLIFCDILKVQQFYFKRETPKVNYLSVFVEMSFTQ